MTKNCSGAVQFRLKRRYLDMIDRVVRASFSLTVICVMTGAITPPNTRWRTTTTSSILKQRVAKKLTKLVLLLRNLLLRITSDLPDPLILSSKVRTTVFTLLLRPLTASWAKVSVKLGGSDCPVPSSDASSPSPPPSGLKLFTVVSSVSGAHAAQLPVRGALYSSQTCRSSSVFY